MSITIQLSFPDVVASYFQAEGAKHGLSAAEFACRLLRQVLPAGLVPPDAPMTGSSKSYPRKGPKAKRLGSHFEALSRSPKYRDIMSALPAAIKAYLVAPKSYSKYTSGRQAVDIAIGMNTESAVVVACLEHMVAAGELRQTGLNYDIATP